MNEEQRFWSKVDKRGENECWNWQATKTRGYGLLSSAKNKSPHKAHRFSWELHFGKIPDGMAVCHKCDNPGCVNPNHLFVATQYENMQDAKRKGRMKHEPRYGEDNNGAMFTNETVRKIREEYATGIYTREELSKKYKTTNIGRILRNKVYRDENFTPIDGNKNPRSSRLNITQNRKQKELECSTQS
jgi:hypothetical protein